MRTELLSPASACAWLEYFPPHQSTPEICPLDAPPFTIGRNDSCDLHVDSTRVSREHAVIEADGGEFRIRDLGSTNGTFLNGQRIHESPLQDGDVLVIADLEYSFRQPREAAAGRATATQVIDSPSCETGTAEDRDLAMAVRTLQERLLCGDAAFDFAPILSLGDGRTQGYEALRQSSGPMALSRHELAALEIDCRLSVRFRQLERHLAVERALELPGAERLLLELSPAEIGAPEMEDSLSRLRLLAGDRMQIVIAAPDSAICDIPYVRDFLQLVRELEMQVCYTEFSGGQVRAAAHREIAPNYLKLSPGLIRDLDRHTGRRRQVEEIARAAAAMNCEAIAAGISRAEEAQACRDAGCRFGQGPLFAAAARNSRPLPAHDTRSASARNSNARKSDPRGAESNRSDSRPLPTRRN